MKKVITILGTGCPKCKTMTKLVEEVVSEKKIEAEIKKVEDIMEIMQFNVMTTPVLVINDSIVVKGRVPNKKELIELLENNNENQSSNDSSCCSTSSCC